MTRLPSAAIMVLALVAFLAPIVGGQLSVEAFPLAPGVAAYLSAIMGGPELPISTHALLATLLLAALGAVAVRSRVLQTPNTRASVALLLFLGFVIGSIATSKFKSVSFSAMLEWIAYAGAFVAAVAITGRRRGPRLVLAALVAGCTIVALKGVAEYASMRSVDPTWRVFAGWVNQNALAGMLVLGLFPALAFTLECDRLSRLLAGCSAVLIGFALVLTQSKGGLLACGLGFAAMVVGCSLSGGVRKAALAAVPCGIVLLLAVALQSSQPPASGVQALGRITNASSTEQQSAGFRRLLWQSSLRLIRDNPVGAGIGTYRFESAKPGLTQQTHLAHNTYLQLGVEVGVIGTVAFLAFLAIWLRQASAGLRRCWDRETPLRIGILSAFAASLAHNVVDSDLYHFGIGISFFLLAGLALQLAPDGAGPESVPRVVRWSSVALGCVLVSGSMLYVARVERTKALLLGAATQGDFEGVSEGVASLANWASYDGEAWFLRSAYEPAPGDSGARTSLLEQAYSLYPSARYGRALARAYMESQRLASAITTLEGVLRSDPNNLPALSLLMEAHSQNQDLAKALETARRTIGVERTVAFQVRAIPELVPTETFEARLFLAKHTVSQSDRIVLLREAVAGYRQYLETTLPRVIQASKTDPPSDYAGESLDEARGKMGVAESAAREWAALCRAQGDTVGARAALESAELFAKGRS